MIGVINVCKERGMTSFSVVAAIRRITGEKKAGHLGTLDPDAEGVLPVCLGKATKLMGLLQGNIKEYRAVMQLGIATDTQDISGNVISSSDPHIHANDEINDVFAHFTGDIMQLPPMYSALKVNGVKLVDAARKGREIARQERKVTIYGFEEIYYYPDIARISFTVRCSGGTYIRTLCQDIGSMLKEHACMYSLVRSETSGLRIENAHTLDEIRRQADEGCLDDMIISLYDMLGGRPSLFTADTGSDNRLYAGNFLYPEDFIHSDNFEKCLNDFTAGQSIRVSDSNGCFTALYKYDSKSGFFRCEKMLR